MDYSKLCVLPLVMLLLALTLTAQSRIRVLQVPPPSAGGRIGQVVTGVGDVDSDGCDDYLVSIAHKDPMKIRDKFRLISGKDGAVLRVYSWDLSVGWGGDAVKLGDLDADGVSDYVLGSPNDRVGNLPEAGRACVFSGRSGAELFRVPGWVEKQGLGQIRAQGDIDADGIPDLSIAYSINGVLLTGFFSGKDGARIREVPGKNASNVGDIDKDGYDDYVIADYNDDTAGQDAGAVFLYSGKTGALVRTWYGNGTHEQFGLYMVPAGDVNRDGVPDFLVSSNTHISHTSYYSGYVQLISTDGPRIWEWRGAGTYPDHFGERLGTIEDVDGDKFLDIFIECYNTQTGDSIRIYSGKTGLQIGGIRDMEGGGGLGGVTAIGDSNGDGWPDLSVRSWTATYPSVESLEIIGLGFQSMTSDKPSLSLRAAETATFTLDAGPQHYGRLYLVLGSLSGVAGGMQIGDFRLPLLWDEYTNLTVAYPNGSLYQNSFGVLAGGGRATCRFQLASWLPRELAGLRFTHSFAVLDPQTGALTFFGEPVHTDVKP